MKKIYTLAFGLLIGAGLMAQGDGVTNIFELGTFESFADIEAVFAEGAFVWKNGEKEKAELLPSDNTLDAASTKMLKLVSKETSEKEWDLQFATPTIPLVEGNQYMVTFDVRSAGVGVLRISTGGATEIPANQYWQDVETDELWTTFKYIFLYNDPTAPIIAGAAEAVNLTFDMGKVADMTYYLDNIKVIDITGLGYEPAGLNIFADGTFESFADIEAVFAEGAFVWKNGEKEKAELLPSDNTLDAASTKMLKLVSKETSEKEWDLQFATPTIPLVEGNQYKVTFDVRSEGEGVLRISTGGANQIPANQYWQDIESSTTWTKAEYLYLYNDPKAPIIAGSDAAVDLTFDMGKVADMTYYLDNIKVFDVTGTRAARYVAPPVVSINTIVKPALNVFASQGSITIGDTAGKQVAVYSITGSKVFGTTAKSNEVTVNVPTGIYIVVVDGVAKKVAVR